MQHYVFDRSTRAVIFIVMMTAILGPVSSALADKPAFQYDPLTEAVSSATFAMDVAAFTGHRMLGTNEVNSAQLVDLSGVYPIYDLSDHLFGTAAFPNTPTIDMGATQTGIYSVDIDPSFYPALTSGNVGLQAVFTDTWDAMFAIDCLSLTIVTASETIVSYYGSPVGNENNGYGIGVADGTDLPGPLPDALPSGSTGTGFDETISSLSIVAIPEPGTPGLCIVAGLLLRRRVTWSVA